jgi:tetratricopeptide (TPR) repeat protein
MLHPIRHPALGAAGAARRAPVAGRALLAVAALTLAASAPAAGAAAPSKLHGDLQAGPHAVGFQVRHEVDRLRPFRPKIDYRGQRASGELGRPLQVSLWYPAKPAGAGPRAMTFGDYVDLAATEIAPAPQAEPAARERARAQFTAGARAAQVEQAKLDELLATPTAAVRDAPAADGRFPLVALAVGFNESPRNHLVLAEHLASHGYVVVATPSAGRSARAMEGGQIGLDLQSRDLEFAAALAQGLPFVDASKLGLVGYSFGGAASVVFQMRNMSADAILSLDGADGFTPNVNEIKASPFYDPKAVRVPYGYLAGGDNPLRDAGIFDALKYSERTMVTFHDLRHVDFTSLAMAETLVPDFTAGPGGGAQTDTRLAHAAVVRYARRFLDAYLRGDAEARAFVRRSPDENDLPADFADVEVQPGAPAVPTTAELMALLRAPGGASEALALFREARKHDPALVFAEENPVNLLGYELMASGRGDDAIAVLTFNMEAYPDSANVYDSLAESYMRAGRREEAIKYYEIALSKLAADTTTPQGLRDAIERGAAANIERMKQELAAGATPPAAN